MRCRIYTINMNAISICTRLNGLFSLDVHHKLLDSPISDSPSMCSLVKTLQLLIRRWGQSEPAKSDDSSEPKELVIDRNISRHYFQNLIVLVLIVLQNIMPISLLQLFKWEDLQLLVCRCNDDKRSKWNLWTVTVICS